MRRPSSARGSSCARPSWSRTCQGFRWRSVPAARSSGRKDSAGGTLRRGRRSRRMPDSTSARRRPRSLHVFAHHPDQALFDSFPGAGPVCAPRLSAAFGTDRSRWQSATEVQSHSGIAPVTERSGKALWVHHRLACPKFVKQTFHEFADQSIRFSQWARAYYDQQRGRGNDHHAALRALAYKWIRILFRCWKDRKPYDEATYIEALRRHASPLIKNNA